ncbi:hypothetical protein I79_023821 [Cricetulus griseus]|uniref:Uncharacterized protein n=1 Tax=Cricetulus griseus TaxID=10029 RepID=G3IIZ1_CRIGR|nr:hypothetical protein I79_023821 [Cricetulus griseus]
MEAGLAWVFHVRNPPPPNLLWHPGCLPQITMLFFRLPLSMDLFQIYLFSLRQTFWDNGKKQPHSSSKFHKKISR